METDPVHFGLWTSVIRYLPDTESIRLKGFVENHTGKAQQGMIRLFSPLFESEAWSCTIPENGYGFEKTLKLKAHRKWDVDSPALYLVTFHVESGKYSDEETFQLPECTLFSGKAVVYLRSTGKSGETELTAACNGVASAKINLSAEPI